MQCCNDQKVEPVLTSVVSAVKYNERKEIFCLVISAAGTLTKENIVNELSTQSALSIRPLRKCGVISSVGTSTSVCTMHVMQSDANRRWERKSPTSI